MYALNFFTFKVYVYKIYKTVLIWDFINLHERLFIFTNNKELFMSKFDITKINEQTYTNISEMIDNDTGVHYLIIEDFYHKSIAVTPRYNSDGTIMCDRRK